MKKIKSISTKILLLVLSTVILINFIPIYVSADTTDPFAHILGEVYIQNVATGMYMDIENSDELPEPSTEAGAYAVQRNYSGSNSQKWIIERVQEPSPYAGEIVIRSAYSGKYLGISYDDTVYLAQYDTIDDFNIWQINPTGNGAYTFTFSFIPTIPDCYTVAVPSPDSAQGIRVRQMYEEDMGSDECDEWYIYKRTISVVNYYDEFFAETQNIQAAVEFADFIFFNQFGIRVSMDGNPTLYEINSGHGKNVPCDSSCGDSCIDHHNNIKRIRLDIQNRPREDNHVYVLWSDRERGVFCNGSSVTHYPLSDYAGGVGYDEQNADLPKSVIQIFRLMRDSLDHRKIQCMSVVLTHEMVHCLGRHDVEHDKNTSCIMNGYDYDLYADILDGQKAPFCQSCLQDIRANYSDAFIEGNQNN